MNKANVNEVGLVIGSLMGLFHLVWALLVAIGVAQALMDFIFNVHMISNPYTILPFSVTKAIGLIIVTSIIGYIVGAVLGWLWNKFAVRG